MFCVKKNGGTMFHEYTMFWAIYSAKAANLTGVVTIVKGGQTVVTLNLRK